MRPIYLDDDMRDAGPTEDELAGEVALHDRASERRAFEAATDAARAHHEAMADLERRAATDVDAAQEVVRLRFQRWQLAMRDGTEAEQRGERTRLQQACAHYNVLAGRVTVGQPTRVA